MLVDTIQTSFNQGEFGPEVYGRTDIAQYANACAIVENFLPRSYGPVQSMPGTVYVATVSNVTLRTRLIKFVFNRTDSYIIEMGKYYFRFYTNRGVVVTTGTTPFVLAHIYDDTELFDVQYTQIDDVMYFAHPDHPPQEMTRNAAASWTIGTLNFVGGPFMDDYVAPSTSPNTITSATIKLNNTSNGIGTTTNVNVTPTNASLFTLSTSTLGHKFTYWKIWGLALTNSTTLLQENGYVQLTDVINSYTATATVIKAVRNSSATTDWAKPAWNTVVGYPSCVLIHDQRLWFARTDTEPQKIWGSRILNYTDFALDTQVDDDGLNIGLASSESNEILWLASAKSLIAGTFGGASVINGGANDTITPDTVTASNQIGFGVSSVPPKRMGNFLYYVQRFGKKIREVFFDFDTDVYKAADRTILAPHILGDGVVDMDVAQNPENVLYCVLTSGTLATMTREVDQEVTGWARHTTDGTYTSIAIIPSQTENYDEAWAIVERWVNGAQKKYIEYFVNPEPPTQQYDCIYLHSALTYDAYQSTTTSNVSISLSATSGSVTLTSSGAYFAGSHVNRLIRAIDAAGNTVGQGQITATASTTSITLSITTNFNALSYAAGLWGMSVRSVAGLDHLEAKTIGILADGLVDSLTKTVASGTVTLATTSFVVQAGLSYNQILQTLPPEAGTNRGTAQGKVQRFNEIALKVNRSTQGFKYGPNSTDLDDINLSFVPTVTSLYTGVLPPGGGGITMRGGYTRGAQIYIKNPNPLPLEILSIMGSLETFEK